MALRDAYKRITHHPELMEQMIDTLGLREALQSRADPVNVMRRAASRCNNCANFDACKTWLAENQTAGEAPHYCRNHDMFERLKHGIAAKRQARR